MTCQRSTVSKQFNMQIKANIEVELSSWEENLNIHSIYLIKNPFHWGHGSFLHHILF